jgi:hypothetical protein
MRLRANQSGAGRHGVDTLDLRQCRAALDHEAFPGEFSPRRLDLDRDLGFRRVTDIDLPDTRAALMVRNRTEP